MDKVKAEEVWFYIQKNFIIIDIFCFESYQSKLDGSFCCWREIKMGGTEFWTSETQMDVETCVRMCCVCYL